MTEMFDSFLSPGPEESSTPETPEIPVDTGIVLRAGDELGKYEILSYLAEGGMGMVYLAKHRDLESKHAIKVIRRAYAARGDFVSRFLGEARIMAALDHRNIVRVTDFGEESGRYYYVMDYVPGPQGPPRTLQDEIQDVLAKHKKRRGLSEQIVQEVGLQICDALNYAHNFPEGAVAHLDLKPSNIMIVGEKVPGGKKMPVKVTDFGFARMIGQDSVLRSMSKTAIDASKSTGAIAGTPRYMSPEQWQGEKEAGTHSDIYSLGIILYEALLGHVPQDVYPPPQPSSCGCSRDWNRIVRKCLQSEPSKRYGSVARLAKDLKKIRFGQPKKKKIHKRCFALSLVLLFICIAIYTLQQMGILTDDLIMEYKAKAEQLIDKGMKGVSEQLRPVGFLNIQSDPDVAITAISESGEQLRLGSTDKFGRKIAIKLPEGFYHLVLSRGGYHPASQRIEIEKGKVLVIERNLDAALSADEPENLEALGKTRIGGSASAGELSQIRVNCNVDGASVYLGNRRLGPVGEYLYLEAFKEHELEVRAPGYKPGRLSVSLSARKEDYRVRLAENEGRVRIQSNAENAYIYQDDKLIGKAGEELDLLIGVPHELEVRSPGYKTVKVRVTVPEGTKKVIDANVTLTQRGPILRISGITPPSYDRKAVAEIIIDGRSIGRHKLPLSYDGLEAGKHTVAVAAGPWKAVPPKEIELSMGKRLDLKIPLQYQESYLEFDVTPERAVIYVDGRRHTENRIPVEPGKPHEVRIWSKGYEAFTGVYEVDLGQTNRIPVVLERERR